MRLRTYLLTLFAVSFGLLVLLFAVQTDSVLKLAFRDLHSDEMARIRANISAVIKSKQERLEALIRVGEQAPTLNLELMKKQAKVEIAEYFVPGKHPTDPELPWDVIETRANAERLTYIAINHRSIPSLVGFLRTKNRILLMGFHLDESLQNRVRELNKSQVKFRVVRTVEISHYPHTHVLYDADGTAIAAEIIPDTTFTDNLRIQLRWGLFLVGLLCLGLLGGILFLFLERGFLSGFRRLIATSADAVQKLSQGEIPQMPPTVHFISENTGLSNNLNELALGIRRYQKLETEAARAKLAEQVAHDLRSPVSALEMLVTSLEDIPAEKYQAINGCLNRIKSMANSVLHRVPTSKGTPSTEAPSVCLNSLLKSILEEKQAQYQATQVELSLSLPKGPNATIFSRIREEELKRAVSNLLDNAVEAITGAGKVVLSLSSDGSKALLTVVDTGRGIPPQVISRIGERGFTANKPGGSGLGLHFAISVITDSKGTLSIESNERKGTTIRIELPSIETPSWYVSSLDLSRYSQVAVVDDDHSLHAGWDQKLSGFGARLVHLYSPQELESWLSVNAKAVPKTFFLCDYEFCENERNGLDTLVRMKLPAQSLLVTGKANDASIQRACAEQGVKLLSKDTLLNFRVTKKTAAKSSRTA